MPLGSFFASPHFRKGLFPWDVSANPRHTSGHLAVMALVMLMAAVGFVVGYGFIGTRSFFLHLAVGSTVLVLAVLQGFLGAWRRSISPFSNGKGRKLKNYISTFHAINGRLLWKLAVVNVVHGLGIFSGFGRTTYLFVMVAIGVGLFFLLLGPIRGLAKRYSRKSPLNGEKKLNKI